MGYIYIQALLACYIYHRGAFGVARFDQSGNARASRRGTGTDGSTFEPKCGIYSFDNQI